VIGVDINSQYLDICKDRFESKSYDLELMCCDMDKTVFDVGPIDYISCALFLEYIDWDKAIKQIKNMMNEQSVFNIVIQRNNNHHFVSQTGIESLNVLSSISETIDEEVLETRLDVLHMEQVKKEYIDLPNGKEFIMYIYKLRI
jgi:hypothetical protein